jgi:hypothetical protein
MREAERPVRAAARERAPVEPRVDVGFGSCRSGPTRCTANAPSPCEVMIDGNFFAVCL